MRIVQARGVAELRNSHIAEDVKEKPSNMLQELRPTVEEVKDVHRLNVC